MPVLKFFHGCHSGSKHAGLKPVLNDGLVNDAAAVKAFPPVEGDKEIREPLRDHQATTF